MAARQRVVVDSSSRDTAGSKPRSESINKAEAEPEPVSKSKPEVEAGWSDQRSAKSMPSQISDTGRRSKPGSQNLRGWEDQEEVAMLEQMGVGPGARLEKGKEHTESGFITKIWSQEGL